MLTFIFLFTTASAGTGNGKSVAPDKTSRPGCERSFQKRDSEALATDWKWADYKQTVLESGFKTRIDLILAVKAGELPDDFPTRPDKVFEEFTTWPDLFGIPESGGIQNGHPAPAQNGRRNQVTKRGNRPPGGDNIYGNQPPEQGSNNNLTEDILTEIGLETPTDDGMASVYDE